MATISDIMNRFKALDTDKIAVDSIENTKEELLDWNTEQLYQGKTRSGNTLRRYRSSAYAELKARQNPLPGYGNPDLYLTGAFYRGFFAQVTNIEIIIDSHDHKAPELKRKYGEENIFGLSEKFRSAYIEQDLAPEFFRQIHKATGL